VGAGPLGITVKALTKATAKEYLAAKPCYKVSIDKRGYLWVLRGDEKKSEKHVTLVGAGPAGMTVKAVSRETAVEYLASKPGFAVDVDEDGRIWVFPADAPMIKSEKHVTRVGAGPMGKTIKAVDRNVLDAYVVTRI
jgi:hypothetical protein